MGGRFFTHPYFKYYKERSETMPVYECDISAENREIIEGLHMLEEACMEYQDITMFDECFTEAFGGKKKKQQEEAAKKAEEIRKKEEANKQASEKGTSGIKKAIDGLLAMCKRIIDAIDNFFQEARLDKMEKEAYRNFKEACKQDPSLKNKKIMVRDYKKMKTEYQALMKECEDEIERVKRDSGHPIDRFVNKCKDFVKKNGKGVAVSIAASAAVNVASTNRETAKIMRACLHMDEDVLEGLQKTMGDKQFKKMDRDIKSLGKILSLKKAGMFVTNNCYKDVTSACIAPVKAVMDLFSGKAENVGQQAQTLNMMHKNKDVGKTMDKAASIGLSAAVHGGAAGVTDKAKYIGKKVIFPKSTARKGIYGNTAVGSTIDTLRSATTPQGRHGIGDTAVGGAMRATGKGVKAVGRGVGHGVGAVIKAPVNIARNLARGAKKK